MANRSISVGVKIDGNAKGFKSAAEDAKKATQKLKQEIDFKKQQQNINKLTSTLTTLGLTIGGLAVVKGMTQFVKESFQLAVAAEGIEIAFKRLNDPLLLDNLRKATRGTVDDVTLMQKAVQASNLGVPIKDLATYFDFAHRRARETGESVDYLVNSIVTGIGRRSSQILDNLGISATELNEELKKTPDYAEAVGNIIAKSMEESGEYIATTADSIEQLQTAMKNLKTSSGEYFKDVLAKPLADAAKSLSDVISGITELREQLELGGANKDFANIIRGNIAAASGTPAGIFMQMLLGGGKLGKDEILISKYPPLKKQPSPVSGSAGASSSTKDDIFYEGWGRDQVMAIIELQDWLEKYQRQYDLIDLSGQKILIGQLSQIDALNQLAVKTEEYKTQLEGMEYILGDVFYSMFSAGLEGWDEFGKAAERTIKQITAEIMTRAAIWMFLNVLTGGTASGGMKLGEYILQGFGITSSRVSVPIASGGGVVLKGRDIYMAGNRFSDTLIKNT